MEKQIISEKENTNILLEKMREKQNSYVLRHSQQEEGTPKIVSDKEKAYAERVRAAQAKTPYQILVEQMVSSPGPKIPITPWLSYEDARALLWHCMEIHAKKKGFKWEFYPTLRELCNLMAAYFAGFQVEGIDPHKGWFIYGPCGCGKSELMASVLIMAYKCEKKMRIFSKANAERVVKKENKKEIPSYYHGNWYFDDLGNAKLMYKDFDELVNPFQDIFTERSRNMQLNYMVTHVSSNIKPEKFGPLYNSDNEEIKAGVFDARVISRWNEMFNFFELDGPDYR